MTSAYRTTLSSFRCFVQTLHLPWSKPQRENLVRLGTALIRERSLPLRRLARGLVGPTPAHRAADQRFRRFLGNERVAVGGAVGALLRFLLPRFGTAPVIPVMLDWTFVGTAHAILWAQIPYRGRSFPLLARVYPYPELGHTQHELALLADLAAAWPTGSPSPLLLADRGFPKRELLDWLAKRNWFFLIRGKHSTVVHAADGRRVWFSTVPAGVTRTFPEATVLDQLPGAVHVVVRTPTATRKAGQRWILLTNMPLELLPWATRLYRHRMQPEQTHRDCKRGHFVSGFALSHLRKMRVDRVERLLCCLGLVYAFLNLLAETERDTRTWWQEHHWGLSLLTFGLQLLDHLGHRALQTLRHALRWQRWLPLWFDDVLEEPVSRQSRPSLNCPSLAAA